jgi:hypothetical protein
MIREISTNRSHVSSGNNRIREVNYLFNYCDHKISQLGGRPSMVGNNNDNRSVGLAV